jgi:hypothetical protein
MNAVERQAQAVKVWLTAAACLLWFVACFWATKTFFFDSTAPFTSKNTYQITASPAEIRFETHYVSRVKGSDCEQLHMYIGDERFKENIDKHGAGTAAFAAEAIAAYCSK